MTNNKGYCSVAELAIILKRTKRAVRHFVKKANEQCDGKLIYQHKDEGKIWIRIPELMKLFPELILNSRTGITFRVQQLAEDAEHLAQELRMIESMLAVTDIDEDE
jgi:hypothetical protein